MNFSEYDGKTVFITGAASGIGYAQAEAFLKQGASVFAVDQNEMGLQLLKQAYPEKFAFWCANVAEKQEVAEAVHQALREYVRIDILVNTAGILDDYKTTLDTTEELWDNVFDTNVKGIYHVTNNILPHMLKWEQGVIVNTASIAGLVAGGGGAAYTASKHAIVGYTKQLAYDYSRKGIRVNAIAPGAIRTPMNAEDFAGGGEMANWVAEETPAGRWAEPEEVASLTLYLASSAADYIHGAVIPVDGGWTVK
ncbi:3-oxoacyl-ACP reductase [Oceanobacillus alkalisoli]|uniref:3-oxoacyl-ACP reductase n=1 Tax=Oceanobacillus alkalisoli TaxID=2925113 RepID=UPI001EF0EAF2|nr:3-oxoacyl-ACP reductase [Oceanobacillus alkalisoli]MCF3943591.1 3-oxoacyl-ACP reductase [Oceanobacillus alkalisoli]MCG5102856.1 3-oxoacyl-ACP reductase [Oceanobacillus alkalisoli]